jgi:RNA polymerase sigma factor (TIGR02999 family)
LLPCPQFKEIPVAPTEDDITSVLNALAAGQPGADDELIEKVYADLRHLAKRMMNGEAAGHTLQPTALVHEAWMRLNGAGNHHWKNRRHFFAAAAQAMRRILVDSARRKAAVRHGGNQERVDLDDIEIAAPAEVDEIVAVSEAVERLALLDPEKAEIVKLRYFAGLTNAEVATLLDLSERTVKRHWEYARAWLFRAVTSPT